MRNSNDGTAWVALTLMVSALGMADIQIDTIKIDPIRMDTLEAGTAQEPGRDNGWDVFCWLAPWTPVCPQPTVDPWIPPDDAVPCQPPPKDYCDPADGVCE